MSGAAVVQHQTRLSALARVMTMLPSRAVSSVVEYAGLTNGQAPYMLLQGAGESKSELHGRSNGQSTARWGKRCRLGEAVEARVLLRNETNVQVEACLSLACHSADVAPDWKLGGDSTSVLWAGTLTGELPCTQNYGIKIMNVSAEVPPPPPPPPSGRRPNSPCLVIHLQTVLIICTRHEHSDTPRQTIHWSCATWARPVKPV